MQNYSEANERKLKLDSGNAEFWLPILVELLICLFAIFSLRETLKCLYADDDLITSLYRTGGFLGGVTLDKLLHFSLDSLVYDIHSGRILTGQLPLKIPMLFFNIFQYRLYVLILICINIWLFGKCVYQWLGSHKIKWLSMLMAPFFFQIYFDFHHPILMYFGLMQLVFITLFSSMYFFWKYCIERKKRWLIISGLFYLWGLVTYEVAFVFILIFLFLGYFATKDIKKSIKSSLLHITLFGIFIIINLFISPNKGYSGTTFSLNLLKIVSTTINQMAATIPLSNFMVNNWIQNRTIVPKLFLLNNISLGDLLTEILFLLTLFIIHITKEKKCNLNLKNTVIFGGIGFMIMFFPSALMGLSAGYQNKISLGVGHIPVYIQYYGLIVLFVAGYIFLEKGLTKVDTKKIGIRFNNFFIVVVAVFILLVNQQYSRLSINTINTNIYNKMLALQYSLQDGILDGISNDSVILNTQVVPTGWTNSYYSSQFYINYSQKPLVNVEYIDDYSEQLMSTYKTQNNNTGMIEVPVTQTTYIVRSNKNPKDGVIYIGDVKLLTIDLARKKIIKFEIDELRIYTMKSVASKYISLYENNGMSDEHRYYFLEGNLTESGEKGQIYKFKFNDSIVDFNSVFLVNDLDHIDPEIYSIIQQPFLVEINEPVNLGNNLNSSKLFSSGWSVQEDWGRWSEGLQSTLIFTTDYSPSSDLKIIFSSRIFAPKENLSFIIVVNENTTYKFSLQNGEQKFSIMVPKEVVKKTNGELRILFIIDNPSSPKQIGYSEDVRKIGIGLESILIETQ